jgi:hypothetical protein
MTIKTTNRVFAASTSALEALARLDETSGISGRDMQLLARRLRVLDNALQDFNKGHRVILYSNWALDAQGNRREVFKAKNEEAFEKAMNEYLDQPLELDIESIPATMIGDKHKLTIGQLMTIDWLFKPGDDA